MGRALAALVALFALTGCVQAVPPPQAGFTDEQNLAMALDNSARMWASGPWSDLRPTDLQVTVVSAEEWPAAVVQCLADAGYTDYEVLGAGAGASISVTSNEISEKESLAQTVCLSSWQVTGEDNGVLNDAELGYLYDYYRESVVPCYELADIPVENAPSRAEFIESRGDWAPYVVLDGSSISAFETGASPWYRSTPDLNLMARCPEWPAGWNADGSRG
jgi:hypothetical protein